MKKTILSEAIELTKKKRTKTVFTLSLDTETLKTLKNIAFKKQVTLSSIFQAMINKLLREELENEKEGISKS